MTFGLFKSIHAKAKRPDLFDPGASVSKKSAYGVLL